MRIAILTDVHGNAYALEAVLADIRSTSPEAVYNLGDTVWGGADPARAWAMQLEQAPPTVRGNTDEVLAGLVDRWPDERAWLLSELDDSVPAALAALPLTASLHGGELLLAHGRPDSAWEALMYEGSPDQPTPPAELDAQCADWPARRVVVVGHTHTELLRQWRGVSYVNAGAVSRQKDGDPSARWVLLERVAGLWNLQFRRVAYDTEAAARWALAHAPDGEQEAQVLRTGRR
jgi:predicted phosphodiesterase